MPMYEYACESCGHHFEKIRKFSDPPLNECPKCGGPLRKLVSSPAFQFKGSGWYITDYARKGESGEKSEKSEKNEKSEKSEKHDKNERGDKQGKDTSKSADAASSEAKESAPAKESSESAPKSTQSSDKPTPKT
jgi:putative FmdB family regulatory protein